MGIHLEKSKTDQEKEGAIIAIVKAKEENYCPCAGVANWFEKSRITHGSFFWGITKHNQLNKNKLNEDRIYVLIKKYTVELGFDADHFSHHSLRTGFITSALENNALPSKIMEQSRHKSLKSLQPYIKHADRYKQHAGKHFFLSKYRESCFIDLQKLYLKYPKDLIF
jgi:integrase